MSYYMNNVVNALRLSLIGSSGVAVLLSGLLYFKQNEIIYPRNVPPNARTVIPKPEEFRIPAHCAEELFITTPDDEKLHAFLVRPANPARAAERNVTILMFHGNAGNIGYRLPIARILHDELACTVLMVQYRGYGLSTGKPDEKGLNIDAQAGLDWIRNSHELESTKVVVYGQSLGGAVGVNLVERDLRTARQNGEESQIAGLILENTFLSIKKMIPAAFPPARYLAPLCHQLWPTEEALPKIVDLPILFLSGRKDEIVPPEHMSQLFDMCRSNPKMWKELPEGTHNDTVAEPGYFQAIEDFLRKHISPPQEAEALDSFRARAKRLTESLVPKWFDLNHDFGMLRGGRRHRRRESLVQELFRADWERRMGTTQEEHPEAPPQRPRGRHSV